MEILLQMRNTSANTRKSYISVRGGGISVRGGGISLCEGVVYLCARGWCICARGVFFFLKKGMSKCRMLECLYILTINVSIFDSYKAVLNT